MDVKQQEYFVAIVEEGSLSKAARRLYISQSSLSQFLSKLESSIGARLFTRSSNNHLSLTAAGKLYYESALQILDIRTDFIRKLSDLQQADSASLTVGINADRGVIVLTQILARLSQLHPNLHIITQQDSADALAVSVEVGELDVAYSAFDQKRSKLSYIEFSPFEVMLVVSKQHPLSVLGTSCGTGDMPRFPLSHFSDETFVLLKEGTVLRRVQDNYCRKVGFVPNTKIETHNLRTSFSVISSSLCAGLLPRGLIPNLDDADFTYILIDPPAYYRTGIYFSKTAYQTEALRDFIRIAKSLVQQDFEISGLQLV